MFEVSGREDTPLYPARDTAKRVLKAGRLLVEQGFGGAMLGTDYGDYIAKTIVPPCATELAGVRDNDPRYKNTYKNICKRVGDLCSSSPTALKYALDPALSIRMERIAGYRHWSDDAAKLLLAYLEAALLIDVADGKDEKHIVDKSDRPEDGP
jgi:hypothetical protein